MTARECIILALDVPGRREAMDIANRFSAHIDIFKVGSELFTAAGPEIIRDLHMMGKKVFLDLKFYDIPNTVAKSAMAVAELGVFMFNVHTMGGLSMMQAAAGALDRYAARDNGQRPRLIGVTVLTSMDSAVLRDELGVAADMDEHVVHLAGLARRAGLDGVVASAEDAGMIRSQFGSDFVIVTPGIRPSWASSDDQRRTMTPREAIKRGSDFLVIGRAVTARSDPQGALQRIEEELSGI